MYNSDLRDEAGLVIAQIEETMRLKLEDLPEVDRPQNVDVYLEISTIFGHRCDYYMVDLDKHALFWLEEYDATWMADIIDGIEDQSQLCEYTYLYLIRQRCGLFE